MLKNALAQNEKKQLTAVAVKHLAAVGQVMLLSLLKRNKLNVAF